MLQIGKFNKLKVVKTVDFGVYLDGSEKGEILLPRKFLPERPCVEGDEMSVFVYYDSEDRLIATTRAPYAQVGQFARLQVKSVTKVGAFIRKTSIDELPQLFNVLKGDMALVGPRPLLPEYLSLYNKGQARRHEVRPGITGWAQVHGRNAISWSERLALDVWYVEHCSFLLDIQIVFQTIKKVFIREGISQKGMATMEMFNGRN